MPQEMRRFTVLLTAIAEGVIHVPPQTTIEELMIRARGLTEEQVDQLTSSVAENRMSRADKAGWHHG